MKLVHTLKNWIKNSNKTCSIGAKEVEELAVPKKQIKILLLTNRDSDNLGDQVIEACDISLIKAAMENLNIGKEEYKIVSRAASIVSKKYLSTRDPKLLNSATKLIQESDIIIFGGAPLFNYLYQSFYERTIITLNIANENHTPVIFSAIGVENYREENKKCQSLKRALNSECVRQITTRDDFLSLQKYVNRKSIIIGKVSDPAVFTSTVFKKYISQEKPVTSKKKIGIFVIRANAFCDNTINFSREDATDFWVKLIRKLEANDYDYELLTSGHFSDEAFLDSLVRNYNINIKKCQFNMNTPERLVQKISSYDAVISCRLHPSIIAFSLNVPSLGIVWNPKVTHFYECIGYQDRAIDVNTLDCDLVIRRLEQALEGELEKDEEYLLSVYTYLFNTLKTLLFPGDNATVPYNYEELLERIPVYEGTSQREQEKKLERKFRRFYKAYNELNDNQDRK